MGEKAKPWMWAVQGEMVKELDLLASGSGLLRPDFARKIMSQGLLLEKYIQEHGLKAVAQQLSGTSGTSEPKASPQGSMSKAQPAPSTKSKKPKSTGLEDAPPALHDCISNSAPRSPANEPAASAPTAEPSTPVDALDDFVDSLTDEPLAAPFDALG